MRYVLRAILVTLVLAVGPAAHGGEVIDRIVATVNRGIVLQSDVDLSIRYHAFIEGQSLNKLTEADSRAALDRLIDQQLLLQEMGETDAFSPSAAEIKDSVAELRTQFPEGANDQSWEALLARYGLTEQDLVEGIGKQIKIMRFVDLRLRPNVRIEDEAIDRYYREEFLPKLRGAGAQNVQLSAVSGRIRHVLTERRIDELLAAWLHNLRDQSVVHVDTDSQGNGTVSAAIGSENNNGKSQ